MSKDKPAKIATPQPVRGTQDMLGDFADRFQHVVDTFDRVRRRDLFDAAVANTVVPQYA